uniref:Uncharacterized protein n=1 Tax=Tetranychus urticae TaxID=32264 RepID=T1K0X7_TETUR
MKLGPSNKNEINQWVHRRTE